MLFDSGSKKTRIYSFRYSTPMKFSRILSWKTLMMPLLLSLPGVLLTLSETRCRRGHQMKSLFLLIGDVNTIMSISLLMLVTSLYAPKSKIKNADSCIFTLESGQENYWPGIVMEVGFIDSHAKSRRDMSLWLDYSKNNVRSYQESVNLSRSTSGFQPRSGYPVIKFRQWNLMLISSIIRQPLRIGQLQ